MSLFTPDGDGRHHGVTRPARTDLPDIEWMPQKPEQFTDQRMQLRREGRGGLVRYGVRAFRGVMVRRKDGRLEYDRCPHAHSKPSAARKCAERAARRMNRLPGGEWPNETENTP